MVKCPVCHRIFKSWFALNGHQRVTRFICGPEKIEEVISFSKIHGKIGI